MKKSLITSLTSIFMVFMMSTMMAFANDTVNINMTSTEFLAKSNVEGVITLSEDITLSDSLKVDAKNYTIDLNGHTLKFTKDTNLFVNNANVTFKNGTINLDGIKGSADCILGVGHYGSSANLTLDAVKLQASNYTSPYALIYVYNESTLNIENNSVLNAKNEKSLSGGVIKTSNGKTGKINITDSTLNFENAARGFVDGTINIKNSAVQMKGLSNGINSSDIIVDNSELTITGCIGRALTVDGTNVNVKNNSVLDFSNSLVGDIMFKSEGKIEVDKSSELNFKTIKLDEKIKDINLNELIVSEGYDYDLDDQGNLIKKPVLNDIKGHWAEETIKLFVDKEFIHGYEDNTFRPNASMTRAEFVKLVNKVFGYTQKGVEQFTDVNEDDWFYTDICIGVKEGYIKGKSNDIFAPNDNITREEVAMILTNIMNNKDENLDKLNTFRDADKTSKWAQSSVEGAIEAGYLNGYEDKTIRANSYITRAEAVSMLSRVIK